MNMPEKLELTQISVNSVPINVKRIIK